MTKIKLFFRKNITSISYRFFLFKIKFLYILSKFIPYCKQMLEKEKIIDKFNILMIRNTNQYNQDFVIKHHTIKEFQINNKTFEIIYSIEYSCIMNFKISVSLDENNELLFGLIDKNNNFKIYEYYQYIQNIKDKSLFIQYMKYISY